MLHRGTPQLNLKPWSYSIPNGRKRAARVAIAGSHFLHPGPDVFVACSGIRLIIRSEIPADLDVWKLFVVRAASAAKNSLSDSILVTRPYRQAATAAAFTWNWTVWDTCMDHPNSSASPDHLDISRCLEPPVQRTDGSSFNGQPADDLALAKTLTTQHPLPVKSKSGCDTS